MKPRLILTENQLHSVIKNSVAQILTEDRGWDSCFSPTLIKELENTLQKIGYKEMCYCLEKWMNQHDDGVDYSSEWVFTLPNKAKVKFVGLCKSNPSMTRNVIKSKGGVLLGVKDYDYIARNDSIKFRNFMRSVGNISTSNVYSSKGQTYVIRIEESTAYRDENDDYSVDTIGDGEYIITHEYDHEYQVPIFKYVN